MTNTLRYLKVEAYRASQMHDTDYNQELERLLHQEFFQRVSPFEKLKAEILDLCFPLIIIERDGKPTQRLLEKEQKLVGQIDQFIAQLQNMYEKEE